MAKPSVGRVVHYVSRGSADGKFPATCRAAIVTDVAGKQPASAQVLVSLAVLNPTGLFFDEDIRYDEGAGNPGASDCPNVPHEEGPHRYCACGWTEPHLTGGTWHWPERVEG